jgi:HEAT repeat protein
VRQAAAEALGVLGPLARDAADELRGAMNDATPEVRQAAGEALLNVLRPTTH